MNLYYYWQCVSSKVFSWTYLIFYFFQRKYYELKSLLLFHLTLVKFKELQREHYPYMNFSKCTVMGREAYKKICNVIIERNLITFDVTPTLSFFSRLSYEANLFWIIILINTVTKLNGDVMPITLRLKLSRMIFTFLKFLILSFLFFSVTNEIADVYLHFTTS